MHPQKGSKMKDIVQIRNHWPIFISGKDMERPLQKGLSLTHL